VTAVTSTGKYLSSTNKLDFDSHKASYTSKRTIKTQPVADNTAAT